MLRTYGANGKHHWCEVLNTIQFITDMKSTYCNKQAILPTSNQNYMTRNIYPRQIQNWDTQNNVHPSIRNHFRIL